ncbi:hypothetical protein F511_14237 [Dorcoceras hygrometricum]|uniref:Uncharacterized protein n=1 Tax=Dorcoceras hygrometricum TaxID=472368 RepID=A0A2Z7BP32_9LAMI|nr:hypothetical protein F511_14237 [Dorcoceras hygrometricum]
MSLHGLFITYPQMLWRSLSQYYRSVFMHLARSEVQCLNQKKNVCFTPVGLKPLHLQHSFRVKHASICAASLERRNLRNFDDGGTGFPPRDDDGGGGAGVAVVDHWSGGFFFFGFLALLGFLKDQESEGPYREERRR